MIRICAIMLNPSKASATTSDRTIDKWCAYVRRWHPSIGSRPPARCAIPSKPGTRYRYRLTLQWEAALGERVELSIANLFAFRATDPRALWSALAQDEDVVGPENDEHIVSMAREADIVIAAWGCDGRAQERAAHVSRLLKHGNGIPLHYLALSKDGRPKHPLYLPGDVVPVPWTEAT